MRWTIKPKPNRQDIDCLMRELNVDEIIATLLIQRGVKNFEEAKMFFRPSLTHLHDPFLMKDMDKAVERIEHAIKQGENILIYGDYDVDGTTAVSLMYSYFLSFYPNVATYIPDRYEEGYGISFQGIDFAHDNEFSLIIALDCGIKAVDKVLYAKEKGIDFIICDHHRPGKNIPEAIAVLDPKQDDCSYPYDELCGCGVGFKLIQALSAKNGQTIEDLIPYLDLVATAIASDIVPITGENRILAFYGLQVINSQPRTGIAAITKPLKKKLTITDVVFIIAPRINAAGRMKHGQHAVRLLTETNVNTAVKFAEEIEEFNSDRKNLDQLITNEALQQILDNKEEEKYTTVVYNQKWHKGVIGIVASRLTETYYRPTLVFTKSGEKLAASARSVKGFDVYNAIEACADVIEQFGGHKYAAGLTLREEKYEDFKQKFEAVVSSSIDKNLLTPEVMIDAEIDFEQITPRLYRILKQFAPFGPGNMTPVFMTNNLHDTGYGRGVGEGEKHLKVTVIHNLSNPIGGIGFNLGNKLPLVKDKKPFSAVYTLEENEWNGNVSLQLKIKDIR
ncbi:single-stranded-DNA-specific exonuclease RecJ [Abyssalbus ytuae]|uniref:Single-stranded-DNA-specific exonuclease RecJ n=1 Tax=Abyssalbus ytuae TaxID=2926907 RepID=A0A9E7CV19_9FLAO|nr:single-stranded-DNA-specific exonuclease RecJ [Abyssalbus ytuae]UOB19272.1 single-stranded-DNA-specific exonuclease RecJ [Abyssalbus ytuae]